MENKPDDFRVLADKIMVGVKKAVRKVVEEAAADDRSLVVAVDGEVKRVPGKELLKTLPAE